MNTPLIKWTGSKRPIASKITSYFPKEINTYYEPFVGGGSVFFRLLKDNSNVKKFKLSDKNDSLINILTTVKDNPQELILSYNDKWKKLQKDPNFFYTEREIYTGSSLEIQACGDGSSEKAISLSPSVKQEFNKKSRVYILKR